MARGIATWNPWSDLERMENEFERWFGGGRRPWSAEFPAVNIWTNENDAVLLAELPGIDTDQLEITVKDDTVTLRGDRKAGEPKEGMAYVRRERESGPFARTFTLPFKLDADKVSAEYHRGVLELRLPRSEKDKPRKIAVSTKQN